MNRRNLLKTAPAVVGGLLFSSVLGEQAVGASNYEWLVAKKTQSTGGRLIEVPVQATLDIVWEPLDTWSDDLSELRWANIQSSVSIETWAKKRFYRVDCVWTASEGLLLPQGYASAVAILSSVEGEDGVRAEQWVRQNPIRKEHEQGADDADLPLYSVRHYDAPFAELDFSQVLHDATETLLPWSEFLNELGRVPTQSDNHKELCNLWADILDVFEHEFYGKQTINYRA